MHRIFKGIRPLPALLPVVFVLLAALLVTGCSFKTVYSRLDYLIVEYVEGMVTLDDMLESDLERRAESLVDWHRTTQLEQYAEWFREIQADTGPDLDDETLHYHIGKMEAYWRTIRQQLNADMAGFLPQLSVEQRSELFASLAHRNEVFREDYVDIDDNEQLENHIDRITDQYENWLGDLSDDQYSAIEKAATRLKSGAERRYQLRLQWQLKIKELLQADLTDEQKQAQLLAYFDSYDLNRDRIHGPINQQNKVVLRELTLQIVHTMSPEQKSYFDSRTDEYIRMFEELAEDR